MRRQVAVELGQQRRLILAGKRAGEETVDPLVVQPFPTGLLRAGIDGEEQGVVGLGRLLVARGVADHQRVVRPDTLRVAPSDSFFVPISWPQMATHVLRQVVLFPLAVRALRCGVAETTNTSACG